MASASQLDDLKFQLNTIEAMVQDIKDCCP